MNGPLRLIYKRNEATKPKRRVYLVCVFRDEELLLPHFIEHYKDLGVTDFLFVNNESIDGGPEYLKSVQNVNVQLFDAPGSYKVANFGMNWVNFCLRNFCLNNFAFVVDADELFYFDNRLYSNFESLLESMDRFGSNALPALLLDMYPKTLNNSYKKRQAFVTHSPFFDRLNSNFYHAHDRIYGTWRHWTGGVRERIFGTTVCLHKFPLVKLGSVSPRLSAGAHFFEQKQKVVRNLDGIRVHNKPGLLLHFKYVKPDFFDFVALRVARNEDWDDSSEYKAYLRKVENEKVTNFLSPLSVSALSNEALAEAFDYVYKHGR